jgi:hypothetical protein
VEGLLICGQVDISEYTHVVNPIIIIIIIILKLGPKKTLIKYIFLKNLLIYVTGDANQCWVGITNCTKYPLGIRPHINNCNCQNIQIPGSDI